MDQLDNEEECSLENNKVISNINAQQTVVIVAIGKNDKAYLEFSYNLIDQIPLDLIVIGVVLIVTILSCIVGCYILFILRTTTAVKIQKIDGKLKDSALIMTVELAKARAAYNESQIRQGKKPVADSYAKKNEKYQSLNRNEDDEDNGFNGRDDETIAAYGVDQNMSQVDMNAKQLEMMNQVMMQKMMKDMMKGGRKKKRKHRDDRDREDRSRK